MPINHEEKKLKKSIFAPRENIYQVEEGELLSPKFDQKGLIPCIITDYSSKEVLMHAYMNTESLEKTIKSGQGHYWSRSRKKLCKKGSSSGMIHKVKEILIDDDQDAVWLKVEVQGLGASCHVGYKSCFYRAVSKGNKSSTKLKFLEKEKVFDPKIVYAGETNPTQV